MGKIFTWDPEQDQTFSAQYGTQQASFKDDYESFWKIPGRNFTMNEDTEGMTLTLTPSSPIKMSFPWVKDHDEAPLPCEIRLDNGNLLLNYEDYALGADIFFGANAILNLSLHNNAKLTVNKFALTMFGKYCNTHLKDASTINISFFKENEQISHIDPGSIISLESPISLEDSSSMTLNCFSIYYSKPISCAGNSIVSLEASQHLAELASFNLSDSASITIINTNEKDAAFDFEKKSYSPGLFNFVKKIDLHTFSPRVTFSATIFNQIILNKLISLGVVKTNDTKKKVKFLHEGGNKYSIGPDL